MKKLILFFTLLLALFLTNEVSAQNTTRLATGVSSECLKGSFNAEGSLLKDSCAQMKWFITSNGTTTYAYGAKATYTFPKAGTYTICGKLLNPCKKFDTTVCKTITVTSCDCKLTTEFGFTNECKKVKFKASSNQLGTTYTWHFGDKSGGKGTDPTHTYLSEGIYKVCVTATWKDSTGKICTAVFCKEIKVSCGKPCDLKGDFSFVATGGKYRFKASSNSGHTYSWSFGDGKTGKGLDPYHEYAKAGTYTVCITITDKTGKCKIKICKTITVGNPCGIIGGMSWKKFNDTTWKFVATSNTGTGTTYSWNWGDGTTSSGKDATHVYKKSGTYEVCLKIYNTNKKCFVYLCRKVEVIIGGTTTKPCNWAAKGVNFGFSNKCNEFTFEGKNLNFNGSNCIKYTITVAGKTYNNRVATHTFTKKGTYTVCIKYYDSCNKCDTIICKNITVDCLPCVAKADFHVDSVSATAKAFFKNTSTGASSYLWDFGDSSAFSKDKTPAHQYNASGTYIICLKAFDSSGTCFTKFCLTLKVVKSRANSTAVNINSTPSTYPNPADAGFFINLESGASFVVYNASGQTVQTGQGKNLTYFETGKWPEGHYRVVVIDSDRTKTFNAVITH